ncbi:hypothetical protein TWF696_006826 [Orbilia brochopaga]|uniref:Uncharacterized protein n=1 Tax=Orbilia brochopaga TaxID=3140254 RepID=A0AAV9UQF5_9PEZI
MTDTKSEEPVKAVEDVQPEATEEAKPEVVEEVKPAEEKTEEKTEGKTEEKTEDDKKERVGIISDASVLPESDDPKEIVKQVEFYFADANLRFDKFLYGLVGEENKWVDIALVAGFNRMRRFKSLENIKKALEDSTLMELNAEKTKMRRKNPMVQLKDPKSVDKAILRSLYAKGFGAETKTSQFDIEKFFEGTGLQINAVRLRRDDDKVFKGSVFVEFKTVDEMKKFLDLAEKPKWEGKEMTLIDPNADEDDAEKEKLSTTDKAAKEAEKGIQYMTKNDFVEMKMKGIRDGKIQPKDYGRSTKFDAFKKDSGAKRGRGGKPNGDSRDWRERRDDDRKHGFKDNRGGRGGRGRGNRNGGRDGDRDRAVSSQQKYRADGVPIIRTATEEEARGKSGVKRARDDEGGDAAASPKKAKTDAAANVSA